MRHTQGGREHWTVNYTGIQSFVLTLSYSLPLNVFLILISWFKSKNVQTLKPIILNYISGSFVNIIGGVNQLIIHWKKNCTLFYLIILFNNTRTQTPTQAYTYV